MIPGAPPLSGRIQSLDSLRGIAALVVLLSHCILMLPALAGITPSIADAARLAGKEAVIVFFILSGLVLFVSLESADKSSYWPYITKRIARIYPPFAVAILVSASLYVLVRPSTVPSLSAWFNYQSWQVAPSPKLIAAHLAMTDRSEWQSLDNVMWSLVHELRISFIFPLLAWAVVRSWPLALGGSLIISALALALNSHDERWFNLLSTLRYLVIFAIGAVIALKRTELCHWLHAKPAAFRSVLWFITALCLVGTSTRFENVMTPVAASLIVLLCLENGARNEWLSAPLPSWLGRVSYSLYLIHLPVLLTVGHLLVGRVSLSIVLLLIVALSMCAAEIMYRFVERPSIHLGRKLAQRASRAPFLFSALSRYANRRMGRQQ